jgi:hypothetical protein
MTPKCPSQPAEKAKEPDPRRQGLEEGLAAAAEKNRERAARLLIIEAFGRLGIPYGQWPEFVRAFYTDQQQRIEYHQFVNPSPFQAPDFDRLNQSPRDWVKVADKAWELHRNGFLQKCKDWVNAGIDEDIVEVKRARGTGTKVPALGGRRRGDNTPINRRYGWAAKYLLRAPLKEIAAADADPTTVGKVAREIVRLAGWADTSNNQESDGSQKNPRP